MANKSPNIPDIQTILQMGINPKNGLPLKLGGSPESLYDDVKRVLRAQDLQDAVNTFEWYNLPDGLSGELIERMLYYRGSIAFFYLTTNNTFYALPYTLAGNIDVYGRYTGITPLPFMGNSDNEKNKPWIQGLVKKPVNEVLYGEVEWSDIEDSAVLLYDYVKQCSQTIIPRQVLNEPVLGLEAECLPLARTSMIVGTGVLGLKVNSADEADAVNVASKSIEHAARTGQAYVPIVAGLDLQDITSSGNNKGADYMQMMQSIDAFRLSTHGITNGGVFNKNTYVTESQYAVNSTGSTNFVLADRLRNRQSFCDIVNSIWGLNIWCDYKNFANPTMDKGVSYDNNQETSSSEALNKEEVSTDDTNL